MKVTGIIMECNPFHEGHEYLLREARKRTGADYIVTAMSGDYVQRGEPAVFDKYIRAEQILKAGADLVLELPLYAACGSAEYFARGGVFLLDRLGVVTDLCFGSESGDISYILENARRLALAEDGLYSSPAHYRNSCHDNSADSHPDTVPDYPADSNPDTVPDHPADPRPDTVPDHPADPRPDFCRDLYRDRLQTGLQTGLSYPAARAAALEAAFTDPLSPADTPNDLLAVEYCRALISSQSRITPHAVPRIPVPSATDRRKQLLENRVKGVHIPLFPLSPDDFSGQLLYALRMHEHEAELFADLSGDIADRIRTLLPQYRDYRSFCDLLKTRNLTRTRISRCLLHLLLQIRDDRLKQLSSCGMALYARPLAMRKKAGPLFSAIKKHSSIPFISKLSQASSLLSPADLTFWQEEIRAEELYTLTFAMTVSKAAVPQDIPALLPVPRAYSRRLIVI